jgi:hypothetical protein
MMALGTPATGPSPTQTPRTPVRQWRVASVAALRRIRYRGLGLGLVSVGGSDGSASTRPHMRAAIRFTGLLTQAAE